MTLSTMLIGFLLLPATAGAQETPPATPEPKVFESSACLLEVQHVMGKEQRFFRSVILGQPKAEELTLGSVRYDKEGVPWSKTKEDTWKRYEEKGEESEGAPPSPSQSSKSKNDDSMDKEAEFPARRGWLEVKEADTSELLPPILQSVRALQCRIDTVCLLMDASIGVKSDEEELTVQVPGCVEQKMKRLNACSAPDELRPAQVDVGYLIGQCQMMSDTLLARERELLKLVIAYDAAERSLYQFLGIMHTFLSELQKTLLEPVWQAVRAFQSLGRIPCFSSQCEQ